MSESCMRLINEKRIFGISHLACIQHVKPTSILFYMPTDSKPKQIDINSCAYMANNIECVPSQETLIDK